MSSKVIARNVSILFSSLTLTGDVEFLPEQHALLLRTNDGSGEPPEVLTKNLSFYGLEPKDSSHVFIPDYSEHEGVAVSLVDAGLVEITDEYLIGPFDSLAYQVRVLNPMGI